jgi:uncharacterized protein
MKHFLAVLLTILMSVMTLSLARAEQEIPQACTGNNLLKDLQASDPTGFSEVEKAMLATPNSGPLLWKIETKNGAKPSYLMGTAHVTDTRVTTLLDETKDKIKKSRILALELKEIANRQGMQAKMMADTERTQMPEGQTLWDVIPDDREDSIRYHPNLAMMPADMLERFQPWIVSAATAIPICEILRESVKFTLDQALAQQAQLAGIEIVGLETIAEQLSVFTSMSVKEQGEALVDQLALGLPVEDTFQTLVELYLDRKVSAMLPLMLHISQKKGRSLKPRDLEFMETMIDRRNINMAKRAAPLLDDGAAFIAVGALHLAGEKGVVQLLRNMGYKLTPAE